MLPIQYINNICFKQLFCFMYKTYEYYWDYINSLIELNEV